jgi:tetratricopeptide (TPR) repeat protein
MLNLVDHLFTKGRTYQEMGRLGDALAMFRRLAEFRELPEEDAEEIQLRLAQIQLARQKFARARRHLTTALLYQPDNPRYHFLMAGALAADDRRGDRQRALEHYRTSLRLDPEQPDCQSECGLLAVRLGQVEEGLACLRRAVELAPVDPRLVARLVQGLREDGRDEEARQELRAALFRNARDPRFRALWNDFQYRQLRDKQLAARSALEEETTPEEGPTILPFAPLPPDRPTIPFSDKMIRRDVPSRRPSQRPPHGPLPKRRHAQ